MSHPSGLELKMLNQVADELREVFAERGFRVEQALEVDEAFGRGGARGALMRDLVLDAVSAAASRVGLDFRPVNGGRELRHVSNDVDRRYRVRRAHRNAGGDLIITSSSDSALAAEEGSLFRKESRAFAWIPGADGLMSEVLIAEILGYYEGTPGHLKLGPAIPLGSGDLPLGGFRPSDEPLDGFGDDELGEELG